MDGKSASRTCTACGMAGIALNHKCRSPSTTPDLAELRKLLATLKNLREWEWEEAMDKLVTALPGLLDEVERLKFQVRKNDMAMRMVPELHGWGEQELTTAQAPTVESILADRIDKALDVSIANCTNLKDVLVAVANIRAALTGEDQ